MGEVIDLPLRPEPEPRLGYWRCGCGCSTFYVRNDENLECAACEVIVTDNGFWRLPEPDEGPRELTDSDGPAHYRRDLNDTAAALQSVLRFFDPVGTQAIIVLKPDGTIHAWGKEFVTRQQRGWLRRHLEDARKLLLRYA